ncbi:MAG: hypothetical protein Q8O40_11535 [Chloroflexota bacterium]|nr:hypothetical protein [Chloroflexota bacterium]
MEACYRVNVDKGRQSDNYLLIQSMARDSGARNFLRVLTDLELEDVVIRDKGDVRLGPGLARLVREFLDSLEVPEPPMSEAEGEVVPELPEDLFDVVVGHEKLKQLFVLSLRAPQPVHILLVGPPATAKSIFLMELERLPRSRYAVGGSSSRAGIVDFIIEQKPRYLMIDELEKMDARDYSALLSLMGEGVVSRLKKGMTEELGEDLGLRGGQQDRQSAS